MLSIGFVYLLSSSNVEKIPMTENGSDSNKRTHAVNNNTQNNTNKTTENIISIPLEKPPFIKD